MATKMPGPPDDAADAVRSAAQDLLPGRFPRFADAEGAVEVSDPVPILHLGLDTVLSGGDLESAEHVGWRLVVRLGSEPVALADVEVVGGSAQVRQLNYGPYVSSVARAGERSRRTVERRGGEVRLLQVPALYVLAVWHDTDDEGTVVVLDPAPTGFEPGEEYPADEFVQRLRESARAAGPDGSALPEADETDDHPRDQPATST